MKEIKNGATIHVIVKEIIGGDHIVIYRMINAAIVLAIGGAAYFFVLGKSYEPAVSREYVNELFHTYEDVLATGDFDNYTTVSELAEKEAHIEAMIYKMEHHHTMYNRIFSKEHYYEAEEIAAFKKRFEQLEGTTAQAFEQYLAPRINFTKVLTGEMKDRYINVTQDGNRYTIAIQGYMKPAFTIVYWPYYHIDTLEGSYYYQEPDYTSSTNVADTQYIFRNESEYIFNIQPI